MKTNHNTCDLLSFLVFVGNTAALSFLGFLRHALKQHLGPSNFTDTEDREMLEVNVPESQAIDPNADMLEDDKAELVQCFLEAVSTKAESTISMLMAIVDKWAA